MTPEKTQSKIDLTKVTPELGWLFQRFSKMVGAVLTQVDAALPPGAQLDNLKKLINIHMYDFREDLLRTLPAPYGFGNEKK